MTVIDADTGEVIGRQVMPDLEADVRAALRDSIAKFGVLVPIVVDQHGQIIDGHNRWELASELGKTCDSVTVQIDDESDAVEIAAELNLTRRHLQRDTRQALARSLREKGHSLRAIAGALDVDHKTVHSDLDEQLGSDSPTTDAPRTPDRVIGSDGKDYPAKKHGPWSPDELLQLLDRIDSGETRDDLAAEYGVKRDQLGKLLTRARRLRKGETPTQKLERLSENVRVEQITDLADQGHSSRQIAERLGIGFEQIRNICSRNGIEVPADKVIGKSRRIDSTRVVNETASTLEGVAGTLRLVDFDDLDPADAEEWATSISDSLRALTRFNKRLKEMTREQQ